MPGADTWSAKEYKGHIYTGDMARGFDVYGFASCDDLGCVDVPTNAPGRASGGGQLEDELAELLIVRGSSSGGRANFGLNARFVTGDLVPTGHLRYRDAAKDVQSTSIDSFAAVGNKATFRGRATVNGVPGVTFFVEVEDLGESGADTFRLVLGDGYGAAGVVVRGNIRVEAGDLLFLD